MELTAEEWQRVKKSIVIKDGRKKYQEDFSYDIRPTYYVIKKILERRLNGTRP